MRLPPQHLEAEQSLIGSLMLDQDSYDQVADILDAQDFYKPAHQKLYEVIKELHAKSQPIDLITVDNLLQSRGEIESIGGNQYLIGLLDKVYTSVNVLSHANIIREKAVLRRLIFTANSLVDKAYAQEFEDLETFIDSAEADIFKVGEGKKTNGLTGSMDIVKSSIEKIEDLYRRKADITGLATGFTDFDKMTSGLHGGELIIVAARPSMGKTAFSLNIASHIVLRQKKTVAYFSLEMSKESVMMRLLAAEARVALGEMRTGRIQDTAWPKLINAAGILSESSLFIDDTSGISPYEIRARARRLKAQHGIDCIIIDYLQLMDLKQKVESRERAVSEISKALKNIAKELDIPVIALAQLNRGVESRPDKRPMLSDLRESGSIEQDADLIGMLFREDYYDKNDPDKQGRAMIIIGKQRNGPTGEVNLRFDAKYNRFRDAEGDSHSNAPPPQAPPPQALSMHNSNSINQNSNSGANRIKNFAPIN